MATRGIVTGAHYGLRDWVARRVTAVVLLVYTGVLLGAIMLTPELSYGVWADMFSQSWLKVATLLAIVALSCHAWVGVRDIDMDYIKPTGVLRFLLVATLLALCGYSWCAVTIPRTR